MFKSGLPDAEAPLSCTQGAHQKVKKLYSQFLLLISGLFLATMNIEEWRLWGLKSVIESERSRRKMVIKEELRNVVSSVPKITYLCTTYLKKFSA